MSQCRDCVREYARNWIRGDRRKHRERNLKYAWGLNEEEFAALAEKQGGKCAGCDRDLSDGKSTHIDHCHESGRIRGILCRNCNLALGLVHDEPGTLLRLAHYLQAAQVPFRS